MMRIFTAVSLCLVFSSGLLAQIPPNDAAKPVGESKPASADFEKFETLYETDFDSIDDWQPSDDGWKQKEIDDGHVLSLHKKKSNYEPKVRSPKHLTVLKEKTFTDFRFDVQIDSTHKDYGHRDACLFFGYKSPTEFYYVHLGKLTDDHCNQIFLVNNADRKKISTLTSSGTLWDDDWHNVRVERDTVSGDIKVYFDDMNNPVMTANDKTFTEGQIGLGSFDDTADFDNLKISGPITMEAKLAKALAKVTAGDAILIDVRTEGEWNDAHYESAKLIPIAKINEDVEAAFAGIEKEQTVYIHCGSGKRAGRAAKVLIAEGYNVIPLVVKYAALKEAGFKEAK